MSELKVQSTNYMLELMVQGKERESFSQRLALACDKAGISTYGRQAEIAARLKLTPKAVSKWLNGESVPRRAVMDQLEKLLGTTAQ